MRRKLVFATNNKHKLEEIKDVLGEKFQIVSLEELHFKEEIPETHDTLEDNASEKSRYIYKRFGIDCFADDTGLEVNALNGAPGPFAARYAGNNPSFEDNMNKLLHEMKNIFNRKARFRTVISLILNGKEYQFEGIVNGVILTEKAGDKGFGYDPVFKPDNYEMSFAQMPSGLKNKISHRGRAIKKLEDFLMRI